MTIAVITMIRDAWGGSEELWYQMAKEALARGHRVIHLAFETPQKHRKIIELESLGMIHLTRPGWIPDTTAAGKFFYLAKNFLRKKIKDSFKPLFQHEPDVVLYNGTCYSIGNEKRLLKHLKSNNRKRSKFFIIGHLNNQFARNLTEKEATTVRTSYELCKKVFFISHRSLATAERHLCHAIKNGFVVRNPVNISSNDMMPFPEETGTLQMATVGILVTEHKGQDILFHALSKWTYKDWQLNIYGSGPDLPYLKKLAAFLQLENRIVFHGKVDDIRQVWQKNQVLLMPSIMEGMPLAVVEAMLCGRICIATDVGGHAEWIKDGESGFIAMAPTVDTILATLEKALKLKSHWPAMAQLAHFHAAEKYEPNPGASLLQYLATE